MLIKTNELEGITLDWAVAKLVWSDREIFASAGNGVSVPVSPDTDPNDRTLRFFYKPSTNRDQGGEIIERERICIEHRGDSGGWRARIWNDEMCDFIEVGRTGPYCNTFLIAAMRCYVLAKMGEVVDVPDELMEV